jgi:hypothetical protein
VQRGRLHTENRSAALLPPLHRPSSALKTDTQIAHSPVLLSPLHPPGSPAQVEIPIGLFFSFSEIIHSDASVQPSLRAGKRRANSDSLSLADWPHNQLKDKERKQSVEQV